MKYQNTKTLINKAVSKVENEFMEQHAEQLDFGHCGFGLVIVCFGRKRKIKNEMIEVGLIDENHRFDYCGKKGYALEVPTCKVPTQYMGLFVDRAHAAKSVVDVDLEGTGVETFVHTWVD